MTKRVVGIIRGNTIFVDEELGLQDGREVNILIETGPQVPPSWGSGLQKCAGSLSDNWSDEDEDILRQLRSDRHQDLRAELRNSII